MKPNFKSPVIFIFPDGRMDRKNTGLYMGCATKTLADWAMKGIGPKYVLLGGKAFYFEDDVKDWISVQRQIKGSGLASNS